MLEFYKQHYPEKFQKKTLQLINEIEKILEVEGISISETTKSVISEKYAVLLNKNTYTHINNLYHTINVNRLNNHFLLKKYLPETRQEPNTNDLLFADFFAGAGGLSQGLINTGFVPAFVNDHDINAIETYYFNHTLPVDRFFAGDIKKLIERIDDYKDIMKNIRIVAGGPPCQGFSMANRQPLIDDPRNILYKDFLLILKYIKPDFFIMENVSGMRRKNAEIEKDVQKIAGSDYKFVQLFVNAKDFGIPQNRERFFLIGNRVGYSTLKLEMDIKYHQQPKPKYVLKDALYGLPPIVVNSQKLKTDYESEENGFTIKKYDTPLNEFLKEINKGFNYKFVLNHRSRYNQERDVEIFKRLPEGGNSLHDSIADLMPYKSRNGVFKDKYFRLESKKISKTITSHMRLDCNSYIHPTQARGISPREAARLQTFPDHYFFRGNSLNNWYQQIGNAVPVKLAEIIANQIVKYYK